MAIHPLAGKLADKSMLVNVPRLVSDYYTEKPNAKESTQRVAFGTSGHRGSSLRCSFNEDHILVAAQAVCIYRSEQGIDGPLFFGIDTHALSEPAFRTTLEVLAANEIDVMIDQAGGYTPTPSVSHAILKYNLGCSSPYAMAGLVELKDRFDIACGNDTDYDRHGIVTKSGGLMNPNHYLTVAIQYLFGNRPGWGEGAAVGKTLVSSSMIDRVSTDLGLTLREVPVGFKWFVDGLGDGSFGFGGEESAGASFLRRDGTTWTTDKDGIIMDLLAAEITATTGKDPSEHYVDLTTRFGAPIYERIDAPATPEQKAVLKDLSPDQVAATELAGESIQAKLTTAPGNAAAIGGLKVVTENGWFAARPSGTEDIYKIYAESFVGADHLKMIQSEAQAIVDAALE